MSILNVPRPVPSSARADLVAHLQRALPGANPESWQFLAETAKLQSLRPRELITRQGDTIPLTLIAAGYGAFRRTTVNGQQLIVGIADPGYLFGFSSIGGATSSSVDVEALTAAEVASWTGPTIRQLAFSDPGLALAVIDTLCRFLAILTEKVDGFLHQDSRERVIRILARHRDLFFGEPAILSRAHLPALVGTTREMTGRVLRELEREGSVARVGRTGLRLLRPDRLDAHVAEATSRLA